jgi:DNA-binding FadR family transcriptional regulator
MFPNMPEPPRQHRSRVQGIVAHLSERIEEGSLPPGARLPTEVEIMRMLGVGRSAVREAMSHLQAAGLVETRHGVGTFVLEPCNQTALLELRVGLEADAAALAAERRSDVQLVRLGAACADDTYFHLLIAESAGNRYFFDILAHVRTRLVRAVPVQDCARELREHQAIHDAITRRDAEGARAAMRTHLLND